MILPRFRRHFSTGTPLTAGLFVGKVDRSPLSRTQLLQGPVADPDAHQAQGGVADGCGHPPDLPVASFANFNFFKLFFNIAGYEYLTEERVSGQKEDMQEIAQRVGLEIVQAVGKVTAPELLKTVQRPSGEPYWKLRNKGACQDIFFITIYEKLPGLIEAMNDLADEAGYPASDMGIYLQPIVQGVNCHCEFNLFYDPNNPG